MATFYFVYLLSPFLLGLFAQDAHCDTTAPVNVTDDRSLLSALKFSNVSSIVLTQSVTLGPTWSFVQPPLQLLRNVSIIGRGPNTILDLAYYANLIVLGTNVTLSFVDLTMLRKKRLNPLYPGSDILGPSSSGAATVLKRVSLLETCCLPPNLWKSFFASQVPSGVPNQLITVSTSDNSGCQNQSTSTTPYDSFCWNSTVTIRAATTPIYGSTNSSGAPYYTSSWQNVTLLCMSYTSSTCVNREGFQPCLEQCTVTQLGYPSNPHVPSFPPFFPPSPPPDVPAIPTSNEPLAPPFTAYSQFPPQPALDNVTHADNISKNGLPSPEPSQNGASNIVWAWAAPTAVVGFGLISLGIWLLWRRYSGGRGRKSDEMEEKPSGQDVLTPQISTSVTPESGSTGLTSTSVEINMQSPYGGQSCSRGGTSLRAMSGVDRLELDAVSCKQVSKSILQRLSRELSHSPAYDDWAKSRDRVSATNGVAFNAAAVMSNLKTSGNALQSDSSGAASMSAASPTHAQNANNALQRVQKLAEELMTSEEEKLIIGRMIGRGAFGTVFQARWRNLDVAVKTVLFSQQDCARQEKAIVEAALATSVIHPNVVSVYHYDIKPVTSSTTLGSLSALHIEEGEMGPKDFKMYLVQELCQTSLAESLNKWVFHDQHSGLPRMDLVLSTLTDICHGCAYIHSKNILWGDLKPENVLLKMDHTRPHGIIAKITDFGMSTTIDPTKSHVSNYNKGTVGYSAPEVIGAHHATKTSDVYSFGVLMQQMVTRSTPWAFSPTGSLEANKNFWRMVPNVFRSYVEIQRRCLNLNQKLRPSFDEVKIELLEAYDLYMVALTAEATRLTGQDPSASAPPPPPPYPCEVSGYQQQFKGEIQMTTSNVRGPSRLEDKADGSCEPRLVSESALDWTRPKYDANLGQSSSAARQCIAGSGERAAVGEGAEQCHQQQEGYFHNWTTSY
ncbi:hypothetical protein CEUSTIGMA_g2348.t1 [Chlamydomonas eustigma]|uniref:Protein kinase domain-containing protein n=1 Tax=Chlamydomonas eustigma TaxID=1157962 RepID=A0A250WWA2_9CHLO|nr:hypothetical protein CEUSTIGMA_g2348.t1 [Chlamydomonas eustigma]|eukprot:GAX74902.1 hypothetical protein CEUSTIGMA_g2348.t1 [Chlamydomonas eustigma]